jgi:hypothetical protein
MESSTSQLVNADRHANVVRLYGYCLEPPTVCLLLELLPTSLKEILYGPRTQSQAGSPLVSGKAGSPVSQSTPISPTTLPMTSTQGAWKATTSINLLIGKPPELTSGTSVVAAGPSAETGLGNRTTMYYSLLPTVAEQASVASLPLTARVADVAHGSAIANTAAMPEATAGMAGNGGSCSRGLGAGAGGDTPSGTGVSSLQLHQSPLTMGRVLQVITTG